jgi:hypothetical protein
MPFELRKISMASIAATYSRARQAKRPISRLCRSLIGDWMDVPEGGSKKQMTIHAAFKAVGNEVLGSVHVVPTNTWLRVRVTPAWFCARGLVYERRNGTVTLVATVRLCHRKKERTLLWQVAGPDLSGCLPKERVLRVFH